MIHRDCDASDMELVNTEIRLKISYMMYDTIQYNTISLSMYLNRQHSDCNVAAENYVRYGVQSIIQNSV